MSDSEAALRLREFEDRHRLFSYLYDDWSMWRVVRRLVHNELVALPVAAMNVGGGLARVGRALGGSMRLGCYLLAGRGADVLVKSFVSALREQDGDKYRDIYFDPILDDGLTAFRIEAHNNVTFSPRSSRALRPAHLDSVTFEFLAKLLKVVPLPRHAADFCNRLAELIQTEMPVRIDPDRLIRNISSVRWQAMLYGLLLRRIRPRAVLMVDAGEYPLVIASRRLGIRAIELQHGIFNRDHPDAVPAGPDRDLAALMLPDVLAVYGSYWKQQLAGLAIPADRVVVVGCDAIDRARATRQERGMGPCGLVVTTQGVDREALIAWLSAMVSSAPADLEWRMTIKLHPGYDPAVEAYHVLSTNPNVAIVAGTSPPSTQELLARADWHLSISSACHYDSLSLGVPTIIIPLSGHEAVKSIIDGKVAYLSPTPSACWEVIAAAGERPIDFDHFCRPGFVANFRELVSRN